MCIISLSKAYNKSYQMMNTGGHKIIEIPLYMRKSSNYPCNVDQISVICIVEITCCFSDIYSDIPMILCPPVTN